MGHHMAQNIAKKLKPTDSLTVFDLVAERATMGKLAKSPLELVEASDTIVTSLPAGKHVAAVFDEFVAKIKGAPPKLFLDTSTIDIKTSQAVADLVAKAGHRYIDSPMSGGTTGAKNGTLSFMVGCEPAFRDRLAVLEMMGKKIFCCGYQSAGLAAKLANNYILALQNLATSEGFCLANRLGLDMDTFSQIVDSSSGQSWSSRVNNPVPGVDPSTPSSRDYDGGFAVALCQKDLLLAIDAANLVDVPLPLGKHAPSVYDTMITDGYGTKDFSVLYSVLMKATEAK